MFSSNFDERSSGLGASHAQEYFDSFRTNPKAEQEIQATNKELRGLAVSLYKFFCEFDECQWDEVRNELMAMEMDILKLQGFIDNKLNHDIMSKEATTLSHQGQVFHQESTSYEDSRDSFNQTYDVPPQPNSDTFDRSTSVRERICQNQSRSRSQSRAANLTFDVTDRSADQSNGSVRSPQNQTGSPQAANRSLNISNRLGAAGIDRDNSFRTPPGSTYGHLTPSNQIQVGNRSFNVSAEDADEFVINRRRLDYTLRGKESQRPAVGYQEPHSARLREDLQPASPSPNRRRMQPRDLRDF